MGSNNNTYVIGDTHFNHENILGFKDLNGNPIRGQFTDVEQMDEFMISQWNSVITDPNALVYHIGDVAMRDRETWMDANWHRLNGKVILVGGNHDKIPMMARKGYFHDIIVSHVIAEFGFLLTHFPVHPTSIGKIFMNIHGHIHERKVDDDRYVCVSVEQTDYKPVLLSDIYEQTITPERRAVMDASTVKSKKSELQD